MIPLPTYLQPSFKPNANPNTVIRASKLRITVLTSRLFRIEFSPGNRFEDRASQVFWYRDNPSPEFTARTRKVDEGQDSEREYLEISTDHLSLSYQMGEPLTSESFWIHLKDTDHTWRFGDPDLGNLLGTYRTLDTIDGGVPLEPGLLSRDGWAIVDDSDSLVFNSVGWLEPRNAPTGQLDLYFFGYGVDYKTCLKDYRTLAGEVPLLPRWSLGNWWSRYWEYNHAELTGLIHDFEKHRNPAVGLHYRYGLAYHRNRKRLLRLDRFHLEPGAVPRPGGHNPIYPRPSVKNGT